MEQVYRLKLYNDTDAPKILTVRGKTHDRKLLCIPMGQHSHVTWEAADLLHTLVFYNKNDLDLNCPAEIWWRGEPSVDVRGNVELVDEVNFDL